jgi:hypothetical protein
VGNAYLNRPERAPHTVPVRAGSAPKTRRCLLMSLGVYEKMSRIDRGGQSVDIFGHGQRAVTPKEKPRRMRAGRVGTNSNAASTGEGSPQSMNPRLGGVRGASPVKVAKRGSKRLRRMKCGGAGKVPLGTRKSAAGGQPTGPQQLGSLGPPVRGWVGWRTCDPEV